MTQKPNDRYYTVAEVKAAKNFRLYLCQFLKDSVYERLIGGKFCMIIEPNGRFKHVPMVSIRYPKRQSDDVTLTATTDVSRAYPLPEILPRRGQKPFVDPLAWMDDPEFDACIRTTMDRDAKGPLRLAEGRWRIHVTDHFISSHLSDDILDHRDC